MTVVVAYFCPDGMVVAADSMITPSVGTGSGVLNVGHHHGIKIYVLPGPQLFAFAGDQGQAARVKTWAEANHTLITQKAIALDYPLNLTAALFAQFQATGIANSIGANVILGYLHGNAHHCCVFEGPLQPRLLDADHYYVALGVGKLSADPFLRFLSDIFCQSGHPTVREAVFLATWTVQHVIDVNPGGVAGPIRVAVFEKADAGMFIARELPDTEIAEHKQAVESAAEALRDWRRNIQSGVAAQDVPLPPAPASRGC
jgi:hypothetical protein